MEKDYLRGQKADSVVARILRIGKANMYAYMVTIIFLLLTAVLITHTNIGMEKEKIIIITGIIISSFIAGLDTARGESKNGWKWGIVGALVYGAIYFAIAMAASGASLLICMNSFIMLCIMACSGAVGGMLGINISKK